MISAKELVDLLEEKDLVPEDLIANLRTKIAESQVPSATPPWNKPITAARLAKWLVDNGHLSRLLAQRLLAKAEGQPEAATAPPSSAPRQPARKPDGDDLGFAPLEGEKPPKPAAPKPAAPKTPKPAAKRESPKTKPKPPAPTPPAPEPPSSALPDASLLDEEILPVASAVPSEAAPLDGLMEGPLLDAAATAGPLESAPPARRRLFGGRRKKENVWDSTLLLVGGGALLGLVILGGVLIWAFSRQSADEMFQIANDFYQQGSYTKAIANYDRYLEKYSDKEEASMARVRRGLAQLRQVTEGSNNWPEALKTAKEVTSQISSEPDFATEGRPELAAQLPKIAEGLVGKARDDLDPAMVDQTKEALALVEKYVPSSQRPATRLQDVEATLALAERQIAQGKELDKATAAMLAAVKQGNTQEAYQIRNTLLRQYPRLIDNKQLREAVLAVSQAEQSAVKWIDAETSAETAEPPSPAHSVVALANRRGEKPIAGLEGQAVFALAEGAAYGLDASTGNVLWRREIGFAVSPSGPAFPPTPTGEEPGSDVLLTDNVRQEVVCVEATTGKLRWRHAIGEPLEAHPVLAGDRVLVATPSGRIVQINLATGASPGYWQLEQALTVAPTVDLDRSRIYQVAEHSNLFVLSLADGKALQTVYLGHEKGAVTAPPVIANRYLVLAENDRAEGGKLRVLDLEAEGDGPPVRPLQDVPLDGYMDTPPLVSGVRILAVTDKADLRVFEISASNAKAPLAEVAKGKAADSMPTGNGATSAGMFRYPLIVGSQVWIADSQLSRYDIQPSKGRLEPKGIENEGSVTLQPPVPLGQVVVQVRRKVGLPGVLVSAMPVDGGRAVWETEVAAPLATEPIVDAAGGQITAATRLGAVFRLKSDAVAGGGVIDQPTVALSAAEVRRPLDDSARLEGDLLALAATGGAKLVPVLDLAEARQFRRVMLPDALGCPPIAFGAGLLAPCQLGQALLLDPRSGAPLAEPFQPRLESGVAVDWRAAAALGADQAALADGRNKLYRVGIEQAPTPHLAQLGQVDLNASIVSPIAVVDGVAYAVDAANNLLSFTLPDLARGETLPLGGRCLWGPKRVGERVLLTTDEDRLYCMDNKQSLLWKIDLPYGQPVGTPLVDADGVTLAAAAGVVWRIDPATGNETAKSEAGYPLGTGPVPLGDRLLVGGHDGSLYAIDKP